MTDDRSGCAGPNRFGNTGGPRYDGYSRDRAPEKEEGNEQQEPEEKNHVAATAEEAKDE